MKTLKLILKYIFAIFFVAAGLNHFLSPVYYLHIMPPYLPWPTFLVYLSGFFEVALGIFLLIRHYARVAAWGIILLLIAVSPANIHMALNSQLYPEISPVLLWIRLPLQLVLIAWAYRYTRPFARPA